MTSASDAVPANAAEAVSQWMERLTEFIYDEAGRLGLKRHVLAVQFTPEMLGDGRFAPMAKVLKHPLLSEGAEPYVRGAPVDDPFVQILHGENSLSEHAEAIVDRLVIPRARLVTRDEQLDIQWSIDQNIAMPAWSWKADPLALAVLAALGVDPAETCRVPAGVTDATGHIRYTLNAMSGRWDRIRAGVDGFTLHHEITIGRGPIHAVEAHEEGCQILLAKHYPEHLLGGMAGKPLREAVEWPGVTDGPAGDRIVLTALNNGDHAYLMLDEVEAVPMAPAPEGVDVSWLDEGWRP